ncbi:MAG: Bug family tripartite tricarboxylate transporter substrate binding protein [Burkholderiales bacterium]
MKRILAVFVFSSVTVCLMQIGAAMAQDAASYPLKPVRVVAPYAPGGQSDTIMRAIAQKLSERWGQPVVVENRAGANGLIGAEHIARSAPDGYSLLVAEGSLVTVHPSLYEKLPYDPLKDFAPITRLTSYKTVLVVHPTIPARNLAEFVALAKAKPGSLNFGSFGIGSGGHLNMEALKLHLGVDIVHVPYKGSAPVMIDLVAGRLSTVLISVSSSAPPVKSGKLRALAYAGAKRSPVLPDVPTFAEAGFGEFDNTSWFCLLAPAGTPRAILGKIQEEVARITFDPAFNQQWLASRGLDAVGDTPEQLAELMRREAPYWAKVIKAANVKIE